MVIKISLNGSGLKRLRKIEVIRGNSENFNCSKSILIFDHNEEKTVAIMSLWKNK